MRRVMRTLGIGVAVALIAGGCSGDDGSETTTSSAANDATQTTLTIASSGNGDATSTADGAETTTTAADTTTTVAAFSVPAFSIVQRIIGTEGDTVIVLLDTESYESLTDIDLQNVLADVVDEFPPVYEAHVVDSAEVIDLVTDPNLNEADQQLLNVHYLVRLEEGFRIRYLGQFEANGVSILGS